jgi:hypothetical protein
MGKGKKGQNRKTVISTTAQWPKEKKGQNRQIVISTTAQGPKEKKDKMTNSEQQYRFCCIADHCLSFCPFFPLAIVLYC